MSNLYEDIRDKIIGGQLAPGEWLIEASLAAAHGTSRTPVREALRRLQQDGLVERGERGLQVRQRSPEEILEIYRVRVGLEGMAARLAAEARTEFDLVRLESAHGAMENLEQRDGGQMARLNQTFHEELWAAAHNRTLVDLLNRVLSHLSRYPSTTLVLPGRWEEVLDEHRQLIDAVRDRNGDLAQQINERHMAKGREIRLRMYAAGQFDG